MYLRSIRGIDRLLLAVGAIALIAVVPALWIWIVYGGAMSDELVYAGGLGLSALTAGIGLAMIRILDRRP